MPAPGGVLTLEGQWVAAMSELTAPDITFGFLALAVLIMWGAWQEHRRDNRRDAALLAGVGISSLIGGALFWLN